MIPPELRARIRRLFFAEHWKVGTIATELGVHHETVMRAIEADRFVRPDALVRRSLLDPYQAFVTETLEQHPRLRATRLFEMIQGRGYRGSAVQLRRYVATVRPAPRSEAYLRLQTLPGEQAQVDWGHFGSIRIGHAMADFDWAWPKQIDREAVEAAVRLDFLEKAHNVVLVAPQGLGKTMIAQNIAHAAVLAGHSVLFTTAAQMLLDLGAQDSARALDQRLRHYCNRTGLLVIDEIGYLSYDNRNADLLFQVISRRYERKSVVITTNLAFAEWPTIFPNAACTTALIDRLVHHSEIISIEGESYRKREAELAKEETTTRRRKKRS